MQGQEKLTFIVILLFFTLTLCCTLISANEKIYDSLEEPTSPPDSHISDNFLLIHVIKYVFYTVSNSVKTIITMPFVLRRLTLAECCSWFVNLFFIKNKFNFYESSRSAIMTFNLFYTDFVGQTIYKGDPGADELALERIRYDQGVRAASYGLLFHCIVGALYAPLLKPLINQFGYHLTFSFGMFVFSLSMIVIYFSRNIIIVNIMASLSGLGMASLTSIPYTLVMTYHANKEVNINDDWR
jgi:solute carrier family 45 protein 3